ncbi:MAG TPA: histidine kinase, partial [Bacteroidia bacterium]|nr:histidine kinase [Bacteroidia bacterium]
YRNLKSTDSALIYAKKALDVAANRKQIYEIAYACNDIGVAYLEGDHLDSALSYFLKSIKIREDIGDNWELGYTYTYASIVYEKLKEPAMSLHYAHKALSITSKNNNVKQRFMVFEHLSNFYKQQRKFDSAHFYLEKYAFLKDSFNTASFQLNTDALIASYQFTEKQKAIELLNQVNQNQTSKIKNQQLFIWMSVISSALLVIIAVLMIRSRKEKANKAILQAKFEEESLRRMEAEKYQKEKERISRDLHDNVGGQLSYILYSIDGLNNENADKRETTVKNINQVAKSVIDNLRDTIWAINDGNISLYDFCDKLKVHARTMFKSSDTEVVFKESLEIAPDLNLTLGLNLYRICQEILNNAFKYSKASSVQITVSSNERIEIVIEDNGVGFNLTDDKKDSYGLKNIRNRAEESNVIMEFYSETGKGTKYKLVVDSYYLN